MYVDTVGVIAVLAIYMYNWIWLPHMYNSKIDFSPLKICINFLGLWLFTDVYDCWKFLSNANLHMDELTTDW